VSHARSQIRDAIVARLRAELTITDQIWPHRLRAVDPAAAPKAMVLVYAVRETVDRVALGRPFLVERRFDLLVVARVAGPTEGDWPDETGFVPAEAWLDALCVEIEDALGSDSRLGGLVRDLALVTVEIAADATGDPAILEAQMIWRAIAQMKSDDSEALL